MRKNLSKLALIFLSLVLTIMIVCNSYIFLVTYKLSSSDGFFEKISVLSKYQVFRQMWMGTFSIFLTILLLGIFLIFLIKDIVKLQKV